MKGILLHGSTYGACLRDGLPRYTVWLYVVWTRNLFLGAVSDIYGVAGKVAHDSADLMPTLSSAQRGSFEKC